MTARFAGLLSLPLCLVSATGAVAQGLPPAEVYKLRLEYREFRPSLTGEVQKGFGGIPGTLLDLETDLGLENKRTFAILGTLKLAAGHKLRGSYTPFSYRGDVTARRTFDFDDSRFERFTRVVTDLKGGYYTGEYEWDFIRGSTGYLGLLVGAKVIDTDALIVGPNEGIREQETIRGPIPVAGATARVYTGRLSFEGEFAGLSIGKRGFLFELDTTARVHISDRLAIGAGYRLVSSRGEEDLKFFRLRLRGWQFGLEISL